MIAWPNCKIFLAIFSEVFVIIILCFWQSPDILISHLWHQKAIGVEYF